MGLPEDVQRWVLTTGLFSELIIRLTHYYNMHQDVYGVDIRILKFTLTQLAAVKCLSKKLPQVAPEL